MGIGLDDFEDDSFRQLDADRPVAVKLDLHHHAILQEGGAVADEVFAELDLLEVPCVHEHELLGLAIEKLELPALDRGLLDPVAAAEALVELAAVEDVLELDLVIGRTLAGLDRSGFDRDPERAIVLDHHTRSDVAAADLGHDAQLPRRRNVRQGFAGCDCAGLAGSGKGVGPRGVMRAIHGLALFSAMDQTNNNKKHKKTTKNRTMAPPASAIRCQRPASTGSA